MRTAAECYELAFQVFRPEVVPAWFRSTNQYLDGETPERVCELGQSDRVYGLLLALAEGVTF